VDLNDKIGRQMRKHLCIRKAQVIVLVK